jgi:hypothetical protein
VAGEIVRGAFLSRLDELEAKAPRVHVLISAVNTALYEGPILSFFSRSRPALEAWSLGAYAARGVELPEDDEARLIDVLWKEARKWDRARRRG